MNENEEMGNDDTRDSLQRARDIIHGDRQQQYGPPSESFGRIATLWSAYLGTSITATDVAMLMILLKVSRARNGIVRTGGPQPDDLVDIAGYAGCVELLERC